MKLTNMQANMREFSVPRMVMVVAAGLVLASCGIRGPLEPAPPLFGSARAQYEAQKRAEEAARRAEALARAEAEKAEGAEKGTGTEDTKGDGDSSGKRRQTRQIPIPADPKPASGEAPRH